MNTHILLFSIILVFAVGIISMRLRKPRPPWMAYKIRVSKKDLIINIMGSWGFLFIASFAEERIIKIPNIKPTFIMFTTRFVSLLFCAFYLRKQFIRSMHFGPFTIPATMNMLASLSQVKSLEYIAVPEFAAAKALRLGLVAIVSNKKENGKNNMGNYFINSCSFHVYV